MLSPRLVLLARPVQQAGRGPDPPEEPSVLSQTPPTLGQPWSLRPEAPPPPKGPLSSGYSLGPWSSSGSWVWGSGQAGALQAGVGTETHKPASGSTRPAAPLIAGARGSWSEPQGRCRAAAGSGARSGTRMLIVPQPRVCESCHQDPGAPKPSVTQRHKLVRRGGEGTKAARRTQALLPSFLLDRSKLSRLLPAPC